MGKDNDMKIVNMNDVWCCFSCDNEDHFYSTSSFSYNYSVPIIVICNLVIVVIIIIITFSLELLGSTRIQGTSLKFIKACPQHTNSLIT